MHNRLFCELCYIQVAERETLILSNTYVLDKFSKSLNICLLTNKKNVRVIISG